MVAKANTIYGSVLGIQLIYASVHFHILLRQLIIVTGPGTVKTLSLPHNTKVRLVTAIQPKKKKEKKSPDKEGYCIFART